MNHYRFEDLYVGLKESFTVEITETMHRLFTDMSGDINPMHLDKNECLRGVQGMSSLRDVYRITLFDTGWCLSARRKMSLSSV